MELRSPDFAQAQVHCRERRRERARHLQGPRPDRERPAPVDRGRAHRRPGRGCARGLRLHQGRVPLPDRSNGKGHRRGVRGRLAGKEHSGDRVRFRSVHAQRGRRIRVRRGIGAARIARRQARHTAYPAAVPGCFGRVPVPHGVEQRRDLLRGALDYTGRRRGFRGARDSEGRRYQDDLPHRAREQARRIRAAAGASR